MRPVAKPPPPADVVREVLRDAPGPKPKPLTLLRMQLQSTIGDYCSFCEMPINVTQAVASKSLRQLKGVPTLSQWNDLLLACDFCQAHRTRDVTKLSDALWPDTDATFSLGSTSPFLYALKDVTYIVKSGAAGTVLAGPSTRPLVIVSANPQSPAYSKAASTIDLFQLNTPFYDAGTNTFTITQDDLQRRTDPRVDLRTRAWTGAAEAIARLEQMKALKEYPAVFEGAVRVTVALAQASGFWSCWMTLLWQALSDEALVRRMLLEVSKREGLTVIGFQTLPDGGTPPWTLFTGTAVDRVTF